MVFSADLEDTSAIQKAIEILSQSFDLVMISDYFEESMILLKHLNCWEIEDVLYLITNSRSEKEKISQDYAEKIYSWNKADTMIYNHFNKTFWKTIEVYGIEKMKIEKEKLKAAVEHIKEKCFDGMTNDPAAARAAGQFRPNAKVQINSFIVKDSMKQNELCLGLARPELRFAAKIFRKQFPEWNSWY